MNIIRRILGVLVMIAGVLGLVLSIGGLVMLWMAKPQVVSYMTSTVDLLNNTITSSQKTMEVTRQALGSAVESIDALSVMLGSTASSLEGTAPVIEQVNTLMGENLPDTFESATSSLESAQQAAVVLDSSIRSLEAFQAAMSGVPLVSAFIQQPTQSYNPEKPLAESLGEVAQELDQLPAMFISMSEDLDKADDNLETIQTSLTTMSTSVKGISASLSEYDAMLAQSEDSMGNLAPVLSGIQSNLPVAVDTVVLVLTLLMLWLLAVQVVVLTQGWELFQGTAGRMEGGSYDDQPTTEAAA